MTRTLIAYLVCSVLALVGVSGAHVHSHGNEHVGGGSQAAERDLGWRPAKSLSDGVATVYRWIESGAPDRVGY